MPLTQYPFGVSSFGIPLVGSGPVLTTGKVFFVDSATGTDAAGRGTDPSRPFKTINFAVTKCTAGKGDTILVMPGHSETCIAAGTITANVVGIKIIGLGEGRNRPTISFTTAIGASFLISGASITVRNLVFSLIGIDAVTPGVNVTAADCVIEDCEFVMGDGTFQCEAALTVAADRLTVRRCFFNSPNGGPVAGIRGVVAADALTVDDCRFIGHFSTACIYNVTTAQTRIMLARNYMAVLSATGIGISVVATTTGWAIENYTYVTANIAAGGSIAFAAGYLFQNFGMEFAHVGASATLDPVAGGFA